MLLLITLLWIMDRLFPSFYLFLLLLVHPLLVMLNSISSTLTTTIPIILLITINHLILIINRVSEVALKTLSRLACRLLIPSKVLLGSALSNNNYNSLINNNNSYLLQIMLITMAQTFPKIINLKDSPLLTPIIFLIKNHPLINNRLKFVSRNLLIIVANMV
jgi:hypothetical protein